MGFSPKNEHYTTTSIFSSMVGVARGSFSDSLTVSGIPVDILGRDDYTDANAINALEPTTGALAASGVATDAQVTANRTEFVNASGSLQTQIDAVEAGDVDSVNAVTGNALVTGTQNVTTQTAGQTITITGPDLSTYATDAEVASVSGTLSSEIDSDIATHADDYDAHDANYTIFPLGDNVNSAANRYLKTVNGVVCTATRGYRMTTSGSIVDMGVQYNINGFTSSGVLSTAIYKNGVPSITLPRGINGDGDLGSIAFPDRDLAPFAAGDILTMYISHTGTYNITAVCAYFGVYLDK